MSDAHNEQSFIRTPKQLIGVVAGFFLVIVIGIILLVVFVTSDKVEGAGTNSLAPEAVAARLRPLAEEGFTLVDANAPKVLQAGGAVYTAVCAACHGTGAAGAPKTGAPADWTARFAQGYDTLVKHAIEGIRAMPAKGGNPDLDNLEVERAVVYMANQSGAKFKEPAAPAAAPAAAAAAAGTEVAAAPAVVNAATASPVAGTPSSAAPTAPPTSATPAAAPAAGAAAPSSAAAAPTVANADAGKALYNSACIACHGAGVAGAPKLADKANWAPRIKQGNAVLYEHAIKGYQGKAGMMPPKGGSSAPDADVKAAVDFMVASSR